MVMVFLVQAKVGERKRYTQVLELLWWFMNDSLPVIGSIVKAEMVPEFCPAAYRRLPPGAITK